MAKPHTNTLRRALSASSLLLGTVVSVLPIVVAAEERPPRVDFNRDIRPILSDVCFGCHGPDASQREADLRLDTKAGTFADLGGYRAVVPGDLKNSELYVRITAADEDDRMPPSDADRHLTAAQIELVRRWILQGAPWDQHWSFVPPRRPNVPALREPDASPPLDFQPAASSAVDAFVRARLEREGLSASPPAERTTLIRRVTLDLTGLPPTPTEVEDFLSDTSPWAYEKLVDRLLASPRYGERMAGPWLDAARYADTNGYQTDAERTMWRWRDWVIDAFNDDLPFDRFTIEQLAGDLLPGSTRAQQIATGFNRNHRGNGEGGIIDEEYRVEYVADRVDTTSTVWLGLTMGCARCHDHKYDPIEQRDFYRLFAYFNRVPERGRAFKYGNSEPFIRSPTRAQQATLDRLDRRLAAAREDYAGLAARGREAQVAWEHASAPVPKEIPVAGDETVARGLIGHFRFDGDAREARDRSKAGGLFHRPPRFGPGRLGSAVQLYGEGYVNLGDLARFTFYDEFSCGAWIRADTEAGGSILSRMTDQDEGDGYWLRLKDGRVQVNLVKRWLDDAIRVETEHRLAPGRWHHVLMTYDGSRLARGVKIYIDGEPAKLRVDLDELNQSFESAEPLRIGGGGGPGNRFRGRIDDVRIYDVALDAGEAAIVATPQSIEEIAGIAPAARSAAQAAKIERFFLANAAPPPVREAYQRVVRLTEERRQLIKTFPTTMVMRDAPRPRDTHILVRGRYDRPGEQVTAGVPAALGAPPEGAPNNRLGLARWLVAPANPLTARVAVNRMWQMFFGTGLVRTVEDFGSQGERPSHPKLLDWLATEFVRSGWNIKALQKTIVLSATYRQSSRVTSKERRERLQTIDPENRLLARGPRLRLSAAMIRDQALAVSGLLVERIGGPSVKPYQPAGLWEELSGAKYERGRGEDLYRRSLYTFWKRTSAPPAMVNLDAAARETCTVRETRTNTPLQALTLMNDVTFVEAARVLAERMMFEVGGTPRERLSFAFRLATARQPTEEELLVLLAGFRRHRAHFREHPADAKILIDAGEAPRRGDLKPDEHAAYTAMANLILNLDETITRE